MHVCYRSGPALQRPRDDDCLVESCPSAEGTSKRVRGPPRYDHGNNARGQTTRARHYTLRLRHNANQVEARGLHSVDPVSSLELQLARALIVLAIHLQPASTAWRVGWARGCKTRARGLASGLPRTCPLHREGRGRESRPMLCGPTWRQWRDGRSCKQHAQADAGQRTERWVCVRVAAVPTWSTAGRDMSTTQAMPHGAEPPPCCTLQRWM